MFTTNCRLIELKVNHGMHAVSSPGKPYLVYKSIVYCWWVMICRIIAVKYDLPISKIILISTAQDRGNLDHTQSQCFMQRRSTYSAGQT